MNIYLLLEALSETEKQELKDHFLKQESAKLKQKADKNASLIKMDDFLGQHPEISFRLKNVLTTKKYLGEGKYSDEYIFPYANYINKRDFLRVRNAGMKSWKQVEQIMKDAGLSLNH